MKKLSVAVIGAGMGGLATAAALRRVGIDVTVYEQARRFARVGAGIQISFFWECRGGISEEGPLASGMKRPKRLVTLQRDDADFVVTFYPENLVVFRHTEPNALRKVCTGLRWKIISDGSNASDTTLSSF